jgi:hypothetical protein
MSASDQNDGICLGDETRWVVNGLREFEPFFRNLDRLLPESGAVVYLEGVSISQDVHEFLKKHSITAWHEVVRGTIWPKPSIFHLPASREVLRGLADLASHHAYPEVADHCHVYTKDGMILQWYDACDAGCPLGVGPTVPEDSVRTFCAQSGATYNAYRKG